MSEFEEKYIYHLIKNKFSSYLRFIDDIFIVWTKSENQLKSFVNEINKKHHSIKFDFEFSKEKIEFLDTLVYKDYHNRLQTTLYKKPTDRQNYLHAKSAHPLSLKKSIPYSQALRIKRLCSTFDEYKKHSNDMVQRFMEKGYKENIIRNQIEKVDNLERSTLLNKTNAVRKNVIPFSVTYSPTLPNIREIINKHWHILNINNTFRNVFKATPAIAFRKNTSLRQIIGTNAIRHHQKLMKVKQNVTKGECIPCNTSRCRNKLCMLTYHIIAIIRFLLSSHWSTFAHCCCIYYSFWYCY